MTYSAWRIASDTPDYEADDLAGAGAKKSGGRWNPAGSPMVYTSETIALSCLETIVHFGGGGFPLNRILVRIDIPDDVWARAIALSSIPVGWNVLPPGKASIREGSKWLASNVSACLIVPSVIVPEERNILINPLHPDASGITAQKVRLFQYDGRVGKV